MSAPVETPQCHADTGAVNEDDNDDNPTSSQGGGTTNNNTATQKRRASIPTTHKEQPKKKKTKHHHHHQQRKVSQLLFYAVRPGTRLEQPVIFFGWKDLCGFVQRGASVEHNTTAAAAAWMTYNVFDNLADAFAYVTSSSSSLTQQQQTPKRLQQGEVLVNEYTKHHFYYSASAGTSTSTATHHHYRNHPPPHGSHQQRHHHHQGWDQYYYYHDDDKYSTHYYNRHSAAPTRNHHNDYEYAPHCRRRRHTFSTTTINTSTSRQQAGTSSGGRQQEKTSYTPNTTTAPEQQTTVQETTTRAHDSSANTNNNNANPSPSSDDNNLAPPPPTHDGMGTTTTTKSKGSSNHHHQVVQQILQIKAPKGRLGIHLSSKRLRVIRINHDSPLKDKLRLGDVLLSINNKAFTVLEEAVQYLANKADDDEERVLKVSRKIIHQNQKTMATTATSPPPRESETAAITATKDTTTNNNNKETTTVRLNISIPKGPLRVSLSNKLLVTQIHKDSPLLLQQQQQDKQLLQVDDGLLQINGQGVTTLQEAAQYLKETSNQDDRVLTVSRRREKVTTTRMTPSELELVTETNEEDDDTLGAAPIPTTTATPLPKQSVAVASANTVMTTATAKDHHNNDNDDNDDDDDAPPDQSVLQKVEGVQTLLEDPSTLPPTTTTTTTRDAKNPIHAGTTDTQPTSPVAKDDNKDSASSKTTTMTTTSITTGRKDTPAYSFGRQAAMAHQNSGRHYHYHHYPHHPPPHYYYSYHHAKYPQQQQQPPSLQPRAARIPPTNKNTTIIPNSKNDNAVAVDDSVLPPTMTTDSTRNNNPSTTTMTTTNEEAGATTTTGTTCDAENSKDKEKSLSSLPESHNNDNALVVEKQQNDKDTPPPPKRDEGALPLAPEASTGDDDKSKANNPSTQEQQQKQQQQSTTSNETGATTKTNTAQDDATKPMDDGATDSQHATKTQTIQKNDTPNDDDDDAAESSTRTNDIDLNLPSEHPDTETINTTTVSSSKPEEKDTGSAATKDGATAGKSRDYEHNNNKHTMETQEGDDAVGGSAAETATQPKVGSTPTGNPVAAGAAAAGYIGNNVWSYWHGSQRYSTPFLNPNFSAPPPPPPGYASPMALAQRVLPNTKRKRKRTTAEEAQKKAPTDITTAVVIPQAQFHGHSNLAAVAPVQNPQVRLLAHLPMTMDTNVFEKKANRKDETKRQKKKASPKRSFVSEEVLRKRWMQQLEKERKTEVREWEKHYRLLKGYVKEFGSLPPAEATSPKDEGLVEVEGKYAPLTNWVAKQRVNIGAFEKNPSKPHPQMTTARKQRLAELGVHNHVEDASAMSTQDKDWEGMFRLLEEYKRQYGDCIIPSDPSNRRLQGKYAALTSWVNGQRTAIKDYEKDPNQSHLKLTAERRQRLLVLGFDSDYQLQKQAQQEKYDKRVMAYVEELKQFKEEHGHVNLPMDSRLHRCVLQLRREYRDLHSRGKEDVLLNLKHVAALAKVGVNITTGTKKTRHEAMDDYVSFVKENGRHPHQKAMDRRESNLGQSAQSWRKIRQLAEQGTLKTKKFGTCVIPQKYIDALDEVGFRWKVRPMKSAKRTKVIWEEKFEQLKAYKEKHGHCEPPMRHPKVGLFCYHMRREYKYMNEGLRSNILTMERFRKLSEIGFRFKVAGKGHSRTRYVDDGSSGYDSSDDENDLNNKQRKMAEGAFNRNEQHFRTDENQTNHSPFDSGDDNEEEDVRTEPALWVGRKTPRFQY